MAIINVPANGEGFSIKQTLNIYARASHNGPETIDTDALPLLRVSHSYDLPIIDEDGRPNNGYIEPVSESISDWGTIAILINRKDVTYFRDVPTAIGAISWQRLGNFETAEFTFPAITVYDKPGEGSLNWLTNAAPVQVMRIKPDGTRETIWLGAINAMRPESEGIGLSITAHGLLYEATYKLARPSMRGKKAQAVEDVGYDIAAALNEASGRWAYCAPVSTGMPAVKDGAWESTLEYIRACLGLAVTDAGASWTVWLDQYGRPSICQISDIPGRDTFTITAGQAGIEDAIARDTVTGATTIFGKGTTKDGAEWRNTQYPNATSTDNRYPLDDPDASFGQGYLDKHTATGVGVTALQNRLRTFGYGLAVTGKYNDLTAQAVAALQKKWKQKKSGAVTAAFWERLWRNQGLTSGAYIAPLAIDSRLQSRLYNAYGKDIGPNPTYDPSLRPIEQFVDFGEGVSLTDAKRTAAAILARDGQIPVEGDITLTVCPPEKARWDIRPGDSVSYRARWGTTETLIVHRVEWSLTDTPAVRITASTRDMDFTELDAAMNRTAKNNINAKKSPTPPTPSATSDGFGSVNAGPDVATGADAFGYVANNPWGIFHNNDSIAMPTSTSPVNMIFTRAWGSGTINNIAFWHYLNISRAYTMYGAVYKNSGSGLDSRPGELVVYGSVNVAATTAAQIIEIPLNLDVDISAGDYWFAIYAVWGAGSGSSINIRGFNWRVVAPSSTAAFMNTVSGLPPAEYIAPTSGTTAVSSSSFLPLIVGT